MITLDLDSPVPPFEQIRGQVAALIHAGGLPDGQRLPTVRQLAADLRVAPGTVARAYASLESEGLVHSQRSRGTRVVAPAAPTGTVRSAATRLAHAAHADELSLEAPGPAARRMGSRSLTVVVRGALTT